MKLGTVLVAGAATIAVVRVTGNLARQRAELRSVDRQRGDVVRANALAAVDAALRHPVSEPEIAIVIAALDEEEAIADVLAALPTELCGYRVTPIVIVDGGTDDTAGVVARAGHVTVRHEVNRGQGDALCTGFALALERGSSIVVTMDADGQHRPEELPLLLEPILAGDADYVQGSRYLGAYEDQGGARDIGIRAFTALINTASGANITDCTNGFRAIRSDPLARLRLEEPRFSAAELLMESACQDLRIREVPVHIRSRSHGESKKPQRMAYPLGYLGTIVRTWRRSVGRAATA